MRGLVQLGTLKGLAEAAFDMRGMFGIARCPEDLNALADILQRTSFLHFALARGGSLSAFKEEVLQTQTILRWLDCGLPAFDLTHGLTAALLLTDPGDVAAELVKLPFATFAVRLPDGFWTMHGHEGGEVPATIALVHTYTAITSKSPDAPRPLLSLRIIARNGQTSTWETREPLPDAGSIGAWIDDDVPMVDDPSGVVGPPDEHDKRLCVAFRRLLVNLCLYVAARGRGEQLGRRRPGRGAASKLSSSQASPDVWVIGREVKLDRELVESARAWTDARSGLRPAREAWTLRARFTVRGHWRRQAHGPGRKLRTLKWIAPFWKGEGPTFAHLYKPGDDEGGGGER